MPLFTLAGPRAKLAYAATLFAASAHAAPAPSAPDLVIYTYDSFVAPGGLGPEIVPRFEKECFCKVSMLPSGDGGQLLSRIQLDAQSGRKGAHIVLGLDQAGWERAKPWLEPWNEWRPKGWKGIREDLRAEPGFLPFDYGVFALMADEQALKARGTQAPKSLHDLLSARFRRSILLQDPRTSTPGLAFLMYTRAVLGEKAWGFWGSFRGQWLTLAPGWDAAYGLFLKGEAPLVWSYTTSQAYHVEHGEKARYRAVIFEEGNPAQLEGAAFVKGALSSERERRLARKFLEFLLSKEVQKSVPLKNWMFPVIQGIEQPRSFASLPAPRKIVPIPVGEKEVSEALRTWARVVQGAKP